MLVGETPELLFTLGGVKVLPEYIFDVLFLDDPRNDGFLLLFLQDDDVGSVDFLLFKLVGLHLLGVLDVGSALLVTA